MFDGLGGIQFFNKTVRNERESVNATDSSNSTNGNIKDLNNSTDGNTTDLNNATTVNATMVTQYHCAERGSEPFYDTGRHTDRFCSIVTTEINHIYSKECPILDM